MSYEPRTVLVQGIGWPGKAKPILQPTEPGGLVVNPAKGGRPIGPTSQAIADYLREHKWATIAQLSKALGLQYQNTGNRIRSALRSGRIVAKKVPSKMGEALGYAINREWVE